MSENRGFPSMPAPVGFGYDIKDFFLIFFHNVLPPLARTRIVVFFARRHLYNAAQHITLLF